MIFESMPQLSTAVVKTAHWRITGTFIVCQIAVLFWVMRSTWAPLNDSRKKLRSIRESLRNQRAEEKDYERARKQAAQDPRVSRAWSQSIDIQIDITRKLDGFEPEVAFEPARLLPAKYNVRLDVAAPGLFTAFGIIGTFAGLLIGFRGIDPSAATESIGGLISGMNVAFFNSLVGVALSIFWSWRSRVLRHRFDLNAGALQEEAEEWFDWRGVGYELRTGLSVVVAKLEEVAGGLVTLRESSEQSSQALLNGLSPKLAESMKVLVTTPFEQLTESVDAFDQVVKKAGEHQQAVSRELAESTASLSATKTALTESLTIAQECVAEFNTSTERLREGAAESAEIVRQTVSASEALKGIVAETRVESERYGALGEALQDTISALEGTDEALRENATRFQSSAEHLERTVAEVRSLADEGVTQSIAAVRGELQTAIETLLNGLEESTERAIQAHETGSERIAAAFDTQVTALVERISTELGQAAAGIPAEVGELTGKIVAQLDTLTSRFPEQVQELSALMEASHDRTIKAYQASSKQVIETVDEQLSDLTDRLHGALATLTSRLPEEVATVTQVMMQTTKQVRKSTRSMDDALRQLAMQTPEALAAQFKEFDSALATAMQHFSGTLLTWEGKIDDLHRLATALEAFIALLEREYAKQESGDRDAVEPVKA